MPPSAPRAGSIIKVLVPVTLGIIGLGVMSMLYLGQVEQTKQLQQRAAMIQQQVNQLQTQNQDLLQQLDGLQAERKALDERLATLRTQLATATSNVERSRVDLEELTQRHDQLLEERDQLQQQVERLTSEQETARERVKDLERAKAELDRTAQQTHERFTLLDRDYRQLQQKVAELEARPLAGTNPLVTTERIATGETRVVGAPAAAESGDSSSGMSGTVELPPIVVRKDQAGMTTAVHGRLMEVNREHNFVVVDRGNLDGVRMGMTFDILRSGQLVGRATVVRVRPKLAACDIVRAKTPSSLQVGDLVVQATP